MMLIKVIWGRERAYISCDILTQRFQPNPTKVFYVKLTLSGFHLTCLLSICNIFPYCTATVWGCFANELNLTCCNNCWLLFSCDKWPCIVLVFMLPIFQIPPQWLTIFERVWFSTNCTMSNHHNIQSHY